jgi:ribosomal-protein-alanine N-acetyltransferase
MRIARIEPKDVDFAYEIEKQAFKKEAWGEKAFREELLSEFKNYIAAFEGEKLIGYSGSTLAGEDTELTTIAVAKEMRNSGVGTALLDGQINAAREFGAKRLLLEVRANDEKTIEFYQKRGFEKYSTRKHYYQPSNVDAVCMQLELGKDRK